MRTIDNGGPAFPCSVRVSAELRGMTLRDYFAAKAMQALINSQTEVRKHTTDGVLILPARDGIPVLAYEYADAMLKERES